MPDRAAPHNTSTTGDYAAPWATTHPAVPTRTHHHGTGTALEDKSRRSRTDRPLTHAQILSSDPHNCLIKINPDLTAGPPTPPRPRCHETAGGIPRSMVSAHRHDLAADPRRRQAARQPCQHEEEIARALDTLLRRSAADTGSRRVQTLAAKVRAASPDRRGVQRKPALPCTFR